MGNCQCFDGDEDKDLTSHKVIKVQSSQGNESESRNRNLNDQRRIEFEDEDNSANLKLRTNNNFENNEEEQQEQIDNQNVDKDSDEEEVYFNFVGSDQIKKTKTEGFIIKTFVNAKAQKEGELLPQFRAHGPTPYINDNCENQEVSEENNKSKKNNEIVDVDEVRIYENQEIVEEDNQVNFNRDVYLAPNTNNQEEENNDKNQVNEDKEQHEQVNNISKNSDPRYPFEPLFQQNDDNQNAKETIKPENIPGGDNANPYISHQHQEEKIENQDNNEENKIVSEERIKLENPEDKKTEQIEIEIKPEGSNHEVFWSNSEFKQDENKAHLVNDSQVDKSKN